MSLSPEPAATAHPEASGAPRAGQSRFGRRLYCPGLSCDRVDDAQVELAVRVFHAAVYADHGFIEGVPPAGVVDDPYVPISTYFAAHDRAGVLVGTARLIRMSALGLPVPRLFDLDPAFEHRLAQLDPRRIGEMASLATNATSSDQWFALPASILRAVFHQAVATGVSHIVAAVESSLLRIVRDFLRIPVDVIGDETEYYGAMRLPILLDIPAALAHARVDGPPDVVAYFTEGMLLDLPRLDDERTRHPQTA